VRHFKDLFHFELQFGFAPFSFKI